MNPWIAVLVNVIINGTIVSFGCGVVYQKVSTHNNSIKYLSDGMIKVGEILSSLEKRISFLEYKNEEKRELNKVH